MFPYFSGKTSISWNNVDVAGLSIGEILNGHLPKYNVYNPRLHFTSRAGQEAIIFYVPSLRQAQQKGFFFLFFVVNVLLYGDDK